MADTIRETIIKAIKTAMESYGFVALAGATVYRGQIYFDINLGDMPILTIIPLEEDAARDNYEKMVCQMPVDISCLVALGDANPSELGETVLGELIAAAMTISVTAPADDVVYISGGVTEYPDQMGQKALSVGIRVAVEYRTDIGNPYQST